MPFSLLHPDLFIDTFLKCSVVNVVFNMAYLISVVVFVYKNIQIKNNLGIKKVQGQLEAAV